MQLTDKQLEIIAADGHLLVTGGPGSGKTSVSILKAARIAERDLRPGQQVLFLSFARATVSRIIEAIEHEQQIPLEQKRRLDVDTYHAFFWRILKTHGYLVGLPRRLSVLTPAGEAIALSEIRNEYDPASKLSLDQKAEKESREKDERFRLACEKGRVCFDLFAPFVGSLLHGSMRIRRLVATKYTIIILDEFQDTNAYQWTVVQALGEYSRLLALADPEQRIYEWIGADPKRLNHFRCAFSPIEVNLGTDNHRSPGTDIAVFGNDILKGTFRDEPYAGVQICVYPPNQNQAFSGLITATYQARMRLVDRAQEDWSLAILVPTKKLTRLVSDAFRSPLGGMSEIRHTAAIDMEAAILGAEIVAFLMQPDTDGRHFEQFIGLIMSFYHGKGGATPTRKDLTEALRIQRALDDWLSRQACGKGMRKNSILVTTHAVYDELRAVLLRGEPYKDWSTLRSHLSRSVCSRLKAIAEEVRNIRLLERGVQLRQNLSQDWRDNGAYRNALKIVRQAFVQEHFSTNFKPESGVVVMNMHKAKGKQFDEVIIFEGWPIKQMGKPPFNANRIVRFNSRNQINDQARQNLLVSVTRAKQRTTILTPRNDPCVLLPCPLC